MENLQKGKTIICIVNYKTLDFIRLCLRSIRKFTEYPFEVIVVDNDSADDSLDYLRSLKWIRLVERKSQPGQSGGSSHAAGLDTGLENCDTEFFLSLHSDVFIKRPGWLKLLIEPFSVSEKTACVGTGKIELSPQWRQWLKNATDLRTFKRNLIKEPDPKGKFRYYNRTICSVYRTAILRKERLTFSMGQTEGLTAGKRMYFELEDRGYEMIKLSPNQVGRYVTHLAHATQAVNLDEFKLRGRTVKKCQMAVRKIFSSDVFQSILNDDSLDE
ncbi:MAG: glycosyltransferase [Sedimentisphaerales bacterium]|nr:glycosyltransferase [Sedimentisphaerales bacterium]